MFGKLNIKLSSPIEPLKNVDTTEANERRLSYATNITVLLVPTSKVNSDKKKLTWDLNSITED